MGIANNHQTLSKIMDLKEENTKLREIFPKILDALDNGSGCTPKVSLEFLQGIPKEIELVVKNLKHESSYAEDERIDIAKELESEKKMHAATQNKLDEMTEHTSKLPWHWLGSAEETAKEIDREKKMRIEMQYKLEEMQNAMFQHVVGLLSTYGKFANMHPEEVLLCVKKQFKYPQQ